jgi:DNA-binding transcriptional MocR family regulator
MQADPQRLLLTSGAHHAISVSMSVTCGRGGTLFTELHTYPGVIALARHHGVRLVGVDMDAEGILPDALDRALTTRDASPAALYVTPTMQNPTAATMSQARREAVVKVCRKHDIPIIEDDVYNLGSDPNLRPLAALAPERTFYANSMSKTLNPTLRIGGLLTPTARLGEAETMLQATAIMVSPLSCAVMEQWLIDGTADTVNRAIQEESVRRMTLAKSLLGDLVRVPPSNGYHLWIPMPRNQAELISQTAAAYGILLTSPAITEAIPNTPQSGLRLCLGAPAIADLSASLALVSRLIREARPEAASDLAALV